MRVLIFGKGGISAGIATVLDEHDVVELSFAECDVTDASKVLAYRDKVDPDWIINCAGVSYPGGDWADAGDEIRANLYGAVVVAHFAGTIPQIHIASVAGLYGKPGHLGYSASKAGVISMVQSLAAEGKWAWAVSPGRVDTSMRDRDYPADTPGSRLRPLDVGILVRQVMAGYWDPGTNVVIRKKGLLTTIVEAHKGDGWKEKLLVGEPVTI